MRTFFKKVDLLFKRAECSHLLRPPGYGPVVVNRDCNIVMILKTRHIIMITTGSYHLDISGKRRWART